MAKLNKGVRALGGQRRSPDHGVGCRLRPVKEMAQSHEYLSIEYSEEEVWLTWTDRNNEHHEKSVRQLAQEARAGNAHDENVLSYYRYRGPPAPPLEFQCCGASACAGRSLALTLWP